MVQVFRHEELQHQGFLRRLIGRPNPANGYVELRNLLAKVPWLQITEADVGTALQKHGVRRADRDALRSIYARAVDSFSRDHIISEDEAAQLEHLRRILGMTAGDLERVEAEVLHPLFDRSVVQALRDGSLTSEETAGLDRLRKALRIDERSAVKLFEGHAKALLEREWNRAIADGRLGVDEEAELSALGSALGVRVLPGSSSRELERMRMLWRIEQGDLPIAMPEINLQRKEECYYVGASEHWERRTVTERINYGGPTVRIKIMKGVYYRAGSVGVQKVTREVMKCVNRGTLHITSKRVVFRGDQKNTTITFSAALGFIPYSDAIEIEKASGRNPIFTVADPELVGAILSSAMARS